MLRNPGTPQARWVAARVHRCPCGAAWESPRAEPLRAGHSEGTHEGQGADPEWDLLALVMQIVDEPGNPDPAAPPLIRDAATALRAWLDSPHLALGGATPRSQLGTPSGRRRVCNLLQQAREGSFL